MAMPVLCRNARPFITHPFVYPEDYVTQITSPDEDVAPATKDHPHVIHLALEWRQALRADPNLTMAELARRQGLSRARVTQILNLLRLPSPIVKELLSIKTAEEARRFPEYALRKIRLLRSPEDQHSAFRSLRDVNDEFNHLGSRRPPSAGPETDGLRPN